MHQGACLCGAVQFTVSDELRSPEACHCGQCRRQTGHFWSATEVDRARLRIEGEGSIRWYRSSANIRRGFCSQCGSVLFWRSDDQAVVYVAMGAFNKPTGVRLSQHIFVADKGDYYEITDGLPQHAKWPGDVD